MTAIELNQDSFQQLMDQGKPFLVDFWAPWCSYCRRIDAAYQQIAQQNPELVVAKVNIDQEPILAHREQIEVIPTLVVYREGKALARIVAPDSKARIDTFLREALEM